MSDEIKDEEEADVSKQSVTTPALTETDKALAKKLRHRPKWKLFWIVSVISLVADQASKIWARASLDVLTKS